MRLQENKYYQERVFKFFQNLSLEKKVAFLQHFNSLYYNKKKLKKQRNKSLDEIIAEEEKKITLNKEYYNPQYDVK